MASPFGVLRHCLVSLMTVSLLFAAAHAQGAKEPSAILELGGAVEWDFPGFFKYGPTTGVEFTPIKDWLEIEAGVGPLFSRGPTEWDTDLLIKKPFTLSHTVECMIGVGPDWSFSPVGTTVAGEVALDFMFWPTRERRYGWFLEPTYSYAFTSGHQRSLGTAAGLLIPIPR